MTVEPDKIEELLDEKELRDQLDRLVTCFERIEEQFPSSAQAAQVIDLISMGARGVAYINTNAQETSALLGRYIPRIVTALEGILNQLARMGDSLEQFNTTLANSSGTTPNGRGYVRIAATLTPVKKDA